jgi:hypothetical protein
MGNKEPQICHLLLARHVVQRPNQHRQRPPAQFQVHARCIAPRTTVVQRAIETSSCPRQYKKQNGPEVRIELRSLLLALVRALQLAFRPVWAPATSGGQNPVPTSDWLRGRKQGERKLRVEA